MSALAAADRALAAEPRHTGAVCQYAALLATNRQDFAKAEALLRSALAGEPNQELQQCLAQVDPPAPGRSKFRACGLGGCG